MAGKPSNTLLIDWSPKRVRVADPAGVTVAEGDSLAACQSAFREQREAIVAINQRSAFVRSLYVPRVGAGEAERIAQLQAAQLFPIPAAECAFGFRLGREAPEKGRIAVVGAVRSATLRKLYSDAEAIGLKIRVVTPLAFGNWLAAREMGLSECLAVETSGDTVSLDLIHEGELCYSRSIPRPSTPADLAREIDRTFQIMERPPAPLITSGSVDLPGAAVHGLDALVLVGRASPIASQLFSFELSEVREAERASRYRSKAIRAVATSVAAAALGAYAVYVHLPPSAPTAPGSAAALRKARSKESAAKADLTKLQESSALLEVAFRPGQTISDAITVLSEAASANSWFTSLTIARGAPMSISGIAMTDGDIAHLSAEVAKNPRFDETKVVSLTKTTVGKRPVSQFMVLGKLRGFLAFDRPMRGKKKA